MKTFYKIIKLFIEDKKGKTIREIAKEINADYKITHLAVQKLIQKNVLATSIVGKSTLCTLNKQYYGTEIYLSEDIRKEELLANKDIQIVYKEIMKKINSCLFIFLAFGSHTKKTATKYSDIDLLFISNKKGFEEKILSITSLLPLKVHVFVFTEKEFLLMKDKKESNLIKEVLENNTILYNIEGFYKLKNA